METANANPEKRFFISLITRDISLIDAILDLIDNAIDALVRTTGIDPYRDFILRLGKPLPGILGKISIAFSKNEFKIQDNCGGITFKSASQDVFRFGHPDPEKRISLSVFGIGMKRAFQDWPSY
jgi:hypothetical protein